MRPTRRSAPWLGRCTSWAQGLTCSSRTSSPTPELPPSPSTPTRSSLARLPQLVTSGLSALVHALDPSGTKVSVAPAAGGSRRISFGTGQHVHLLLDGSTPAIEFGCDVEILDRDGDPVGRIVVERLRLTPTGVQVCLRGGPFSSLRAP